VIEKKHLSISEKELVMFIEQKMVKKITNAFGEESQKLTEIMELL